MVGTAFYVFTKTDRAPSLMGSLASADVSNKLQSRMSRYVRHDDAKR
jgi:hypothetical protein